MRRIRIVLAGAAVMVAALLAFQAPALADRIDFETEDFGNAECLFLVEKERHDVDADLIGCAPEDSEGFVSPAFLDLSASDLEDFVEDDVAFDNRGRIDLDF